MASSSDPSEDRQLVKSIRSLSRRELKEAAGFSPAPQLQNGRVSISSTVGKRLANAEADKCLDHEGSDVAISFSKPKRRLSVKFPFFSRAEKRESRSAEEEFYDKRSEGASRMGSERILKKGKPRISRRISQSIQKSLAKLQRKKKKRRQRLSTIGKGSVSRRTQSELGNSKPYKRERVNTKSTLSLAEESSEKVMGKAVFDDYYSEDSFDDDDGSVFSEESEQVLDRKEKARLFYQGTKQPTLISGSSVTSLPESLGSVGHHIGTSSTQLQRVKLMSDQDLPKVDGSFFSLLSSSNKIHRPSNKIKVVNVGNSSGPDYKRVIALGFNFNLRIHHRPENKEPKAPPTMPLPGASYYSHKHRLNSVAYGHGKINYEEENTTSFEESLLSV
eukprot:augustus_masked-scaffold_72-processed-gene-0.10-mRNA-1 protein AED:1.00 eAED:1.00 QI:0/-1/0/0/-1/1/1/0/388